MRNLTKALLVGTTSLFLMGSQCSFNTSQKSPVEKKICERSLNLFSYDGKLLGHFENITLAHAGNHTTYVGFLDSEGKSHTFSGIYHYISTCDE